MDIDSKPTGPNRVGKSLPIMFCIVRTAGASPAELTIYVWFVTKFIASGASPDASCPSLLALISAAGANPDARITNSTCKNELVDIVS